MEIPIVDDVMKEPEPPPPKRKRDEEDVDVDVSPKSDENQVGQAVAMESTAQPSSGPVPMQAVPSSSEEDMESDTDGGGTPGMDSPTVTYASDRGTVSPPTSDQDMGLLQHDMHCWDFAKRRYGDIGHVDVAEVFSPPRVALVAERMGFKAGSSLDITGNDERGVPWNFNNKVMRDKAMKKYIEEEPFLLVGSPVCTMWSQMMNINKNKMDLLEYSQRMSEARVHMNFVCKLYMMQHKAGRYFIHEQPQAARSWEEECVQRTMRETNSQRLLIHQCMYGLVSVDTNGKTNPARTAT